MLSYIYSFFASDRDNFAGVDPVPPPGPTRQCRFQRDDSTSSTFDLPDGRKLGYAQYGAPAGKPIICFHGMPGSRVEGALFHQNALKHNARIIYLDRPGIGWSSPQPNRSILDHAKDAERLAEHLKLDKYLVMATSGGGPYGLACARSMPSNRLRGVAIVTGIGNPDMDASQTTWMSYAALKLGSFLSPAVARAFFRSQPAGQLEVDDEKRVAMMREGFRRAQLHSREMEFLKDRERLEDEFRVVMKVSHEAFGKGFEGVAQDAQLLTQPWTFKIEDIRKDLPVQLWYGKADARAPAIWGQQTAERLGKNATLHVLNETHGSLQWHYQDKIIEDLVSLF